MRCPVLNSSRQAVGHIVASRTNKPFLVQTIGTFRNIIMTLYNVLVIVDISRMDRVLVVVDDDTVNRGA